MFEPTCELGNGATVTLPGIAYIEKREYEENVGGRERKYPGLCISWGYTWRNFKFYTEEARDSAHSILKSALDSYLSDVDKYRSPSAWPNCPREHYYPHSMKYGGVE